MPYKTIKELPEAFKNLPDEAKTIAMNVINSALDGGSDEASAFKQAWGAIKKSYKQDDDGNWTKLDEALETVDITGVEILATGTWKGYPESKTYKKNDLKAAVKSFNELSGNKKLNYEPPIKLGHDGNQKLLQKDGLPSAGWVSSLKAVGSKLVADFKDVPKKIGDIISAGGYKKVSSELYHNYEIAGKKYPLVLKAVALLGGDIPAVKTIADIQTNYSEGDMENVDTVIYEFGEEVKDNRELVKAVFAREYGLAEDEELHKKIDSVYKAFSDKFSNNDVAEPGCYIKEVYTDYVIASGKKGELIKIPYSEKDGVIEFDTDKTAKVEKVYKVIGETASVQGESPVDSASTGEGDNKHKEVEEKMLKETREILGLAEETKEEDVINAIKTLKAKADTKTPADSLAEKVDGLDTKLRENEASTMVAQAITDGKITPKQKEWASDYAKNNPEGFIAFTENASKVIDLEESGGEGGDTSDVALTQKDIEVGKTMGISEEELLAEKKSEIEEAK